MSLKNKAAAFKLGEKTPVFILAVILCVAALLRFYHFGHNDFWYDEAWNLTNGRVLTASSFATFQTGPILFFFITHILFLLKSSELVLRMIPLIFGLVSIPALYLLASTLFNQRVGLISAFLIAISPIQIYYSQEYSSYSLIVFFSIMLVYFFIKMLRENTLFYRVGFIAFASFSLYTHYSALFLLFSLNAAFFLCFRCRGVAIRQWLIVQGIIFLLFIPHLSWSIDHARRIMVSDVFFWVPELNFQTFIHTFAVFTLGYNADHFLYNIALLLFFPLFFKGVIKNQKEDFKGGTYLLLLWLFAPHIIILAVSILFKGTTHYLYRSFIYISPAYYILVANGLNKITKRIVIIFVLLAFILLSAISLNNYFSDKFPLPVFPYRPSIFEKKENKAAARYIKERYYPGDIVLHTCRATFTPFLYYHNNELSEKWIFTDKDMDWKYWRKFLYAFPLTGIQQKWFDSVFQYGLPSLPGEYKRLWLVTAGWGLTDELQLDIKDWMDKQFTLLDSKPFRGLNVYLYDCSMSARRHQ